jgi:hypothetical protein
VTVRYANAARDVEAHRAAAHVPDLRLADEHQPELVAAPEAGFDLPNGAAIACEIEEDHL